MILHCPGANNFRQPSADLIKCPHCSYEVEIWADEVQAICPNCKNKVLREDDKASCLDWCKYAKECVGEQTYNRYILNKSAMLKHRLIKKLEDHFGDDNKRIKHAKKVLGYAEELLKDEKADWYIVVPASILHDVGIKAAEEKYGSSAGHYQEKEGPAIAKKILLNIGIRKEDIEEIAEIIAHHHSPGIVNSANFKVLYDADWLVNLKDEIKTDDIHKLKGLIKKVFLTEAGRKMAEELYIKEEERDVL